MKKYLQYILIATISAVLLSACNKDEDNTVTLTAIVADQLNGGNAKVYINETGGVKYGCWQNGDTVSINGAKKYLSVTSGESLTAAINDVDASNTGYTASYPYGKTTYGGTPKSISIDIPAVQEYISADDYSGTGASAKQRLLCPMAAYCGSNGSSLKFHNVGAVLKVTVSNSYEELLTLHSVEVESEDATVPLSGTCSVTMNDAGEISEATYEGSSKTTLDLSNAGKSLEKNGDPIDLYIPIMPIKESKKTKITIHVYAKGTPDGASSENKYTFHGTSASTVWVDRNQIGAVSIELSSSNKTANDPYFWGQGNEYCPFLIESKEDFITLRNIVARIGDFAGMDNDATYNNSDVYYKQTQNVDISDSTLWGQSGSHYAIGTTEHPFASNYDGGGCSVTLGVTSAVKDYPVGVFGVIGAAYIHNLNAAGEIRTGNVFASAGGICGRISGDAVIQNCFSSISISNTKYENTGINDTISGFGGIVGVIQSGNFKITTCKFEDPGILSVYRLPAGGICGRIKGSVCGNCAIDERCIQDCINKGTVKVAYLNSTSYTIGQIGGICGTIRGSNIKVIKCTNSGSVILDLPSNNSQTGYRAGGIVGQNGTGAANENLSQLTISKCINKGTVGMVKDNEAYGVLGGILGCNLRDVLIESCSNESEVTMDGGIKTYTEIGGILGRAQHKTAIIRNCINKTVIDNAKCGGGIVGRMYVGSSAGCYPVIKIENCLSFGKNNSKITYSAGICGYIDSKYVNASKQTRGSAAAYYKNCVIAYPTGGSTLTATIVGQNNAVSTTIHNVYTDYAFHSPTDIPVYNSTNKSSISSYYTYDNGGEFSDADVKTYLSLSNTLNDWIKDESGAPSNYVKWITTGDIIPEIPLIIGCDSFE